ncbi:shikimate kinase [Paenibacillus camelliae]|uniref:shikimate kinase n=1 Tax=Paenibacillus camelliae TaxID=512410 RepID=UPI00203A749B|nr:shikimate kinase [Paenibacillus camelliae]MCM3632185.1 shikimate kinase [Paenibacillus camelliae]
MSDFNKIILIGFMGTGKSSVAEALAEALQLPNLDVDKEIVASDGRVIPDIFVQEGEDGFRTIETNVLKQLLELPHPAIIATGGGAVLKAVNRELMLASGLVIQLSASADVIISRVSNDRGRPLLQGDVAERVHTLLEARANAYDFAHLTIDTSDQSISQIVNEIANAWHKSQSR